MFINIKKIIMIYLFFVGISFFSNQVFAISLTEQIKKIDDAVRLGNQESIFEEYDKKLKNDPKNSNLIFLKAWAMLDLEESWLVFNKFINADYNFYWGHVAIGKIYNIWRVDDKAFKHLKHAINLAPKIPYAYNLLGSLYYERNELNEAEKTFNEVLQFDNSNPGAILGIGKIYFEKKQSSKALSLLKTAVQRDPNNFSLRAMLVDVYKKMGNKSEALKQLKKAASLDENNFGVTYSLAKMFQDRGEIVDAISLFKRALKIDSNHFDSNYQLASIYLKRDQKINAIDYFEKCAKLKEDHLNTHLMLARLFKEKKYFDKTKTEFEKVLELDSKNTEALLGIARILAKWKKYRETIEAYEKLVKLQPDNKNAISELNGLFKKLSINHQRISGANLNQVFARNLYFINKFYKTKARKKKRMRGTISVKVDLDATGSVNDLEIVRDELRDREINACIYWNIKRSKFPVGMKGSYTYTMKLQPGG